MTSYPQNLHTHGPFCDGKTDYEDMIKSAINQGLKSIGFSGHGFTYFDSSCCMTKEDSLKYKKLIGELKEKYKDQIEIFCGIEFDVYTEDDIFSYDYVIGDAHYIKKDGEFLIVDYSDPKMTLENIEKHYGGNSLLYAKDYYETLSLVRDLPKCDIVGHFDLITKLCEKYSFLDTESKQYQNYALEALDAIAEKVKVFEINVSGIARGYKSVPYPAPFILKRINDLGCDVIITTDCHNESYLTKNVDVGIELAKSCGFNHLVTLTKNGFEKFKI